MSSDASFRSGPAQEPAATARQHHAERPEMLFAMAALAALGCLSLVIGVVIGHLVVPNHNLFADTISDLAAGPSEIFVDVALYGFAAGLFATALAASHAHLGKAAWSLGTIGFAILAALVVVIAARNEYGDGDNEGVVIHIYLVYALGILFVAAPLCLGGALKRDHPRERRWLLRLTALWALAAPVFFVLPTGIDGIYENMLGIIAIGIVLVLARVFHRRARALAQDRGT